MLQTELLPEQCSKPFDDMINAVASINKLSDSVEVGLENEHFRTVCISAERQDRPTFSSHPRFAARYADSQV